MDASHDFVRHVAVERVVARKSLNTRLTKLATDFEEGCAHGDAKGLGFARTGDDAAVVVSE